ncbi:hypothetical protein C8J57DRAFT_1175396 [Mycena rebaudengoi]|nr:hypothetical protein C8J57DRAFT_1175396 [Mycena rebaudengoi]
MVPPLEAKKSKGITEPVTIDLQDPPGQVTSRIDPSNQIHMISCDLCGTEIRTTRAANRYNFIKHRQSCKQKLHLKQAQSQTLRKSPLGTPDFFVMILQPCPGVSIQWTPGSHWMTYPYLQHGVRDVGWEPISFGQDNTIQFRAETCHGHISSGSHEACIPCRVLPSSSKFQMFMMRATEALPSTPWEYLNAEQQLKLMKGMAKTSKELRTKASNIGRKISEHRRIMMLLATNDVPGLRRMLTTLTKRGASPHAIGFTLDRAIAGLFSARGGFTPRDMDIAFLSKAIGGPRLLYALQKSHGFASLSTVKRHKKIPKLVASIGVPTRTDIWANISSFLDPEIKPAPTNPGAGNVLMFDGIALETRCRYCPDRDAVSGLCREHSHRVNTTVDSLESIENIRQALQKDKKDPGKVCFGSDGTVVAIAPYAELEHYTPVPLVLSPSCKTEKGVELAKWMQTVLDTWDNHPQGRALHGRIEALASDGDSSYRLAKHIICMVKEIDPESPLGKKLYPLVGLNCFTSKDGQVSTGDPKHIMKRDATLLRNPGGIMVGATNIRPEDIVAHLAALPDVTIEQARQLLDPSDKQNVPKAVALVQQLNKVGNLPPPVNPTDVQTRKAVVFFSKVLSFFVNPFINVEMSLSEQVESLATYAFLAAALEIKHGSFCFTGPLYSDSQATIKNIIIMIAKMQLVNPNLKFYIILEGTDRLEVVFSDCRTQDHARNFDIDQLAGKLGVAALINAAFQRNPDLDRGHRRLSLKAALGIDHINPASWEADACVGNVDLRKRWDAAEMKANNLLEDYFGPAGRVDFATRFADRKSDLLRPLGHYVGLDAKHEDKRSEEESNVPLFPVGEDSENPLENKDDDDDRPGVLSPEELQSVQNDFADEDFQDMPLGMDLDQFFPDKPLRDHNDGTNQDEEEPAAFSKVLEVEGKKYLKSSLVATLSSNRSKKATMRTLRVRGVALEDLRSRKCEEFDITDLDDEDLLKSGDLVATLVHSGKKICLAIFLVKGIRIGADKSIRTAASLLDLGNPESKATVLGQLMEMRNPLPDTENADPATFWEWSGQYLSLDVTARDDRETRRMFVAEIPGVLIHPVGPSVSKASGSQGQATWSIPSQQLSEILDEAWQSLEPEGKEIATNVEQLITVLNPNSIPYRNALGTPSLIVQNVPEHLTRQKLRATDKISCLICGVEELLNAVGSEPCGFCGLDGCFTQLINLNHPKKPISIKSSCRYHFSRLNYKKAKNQSNRAPSTNLPIHCSLCPVNKLSGEPPTIWKYNAMFHIIAEHSLQENSLPPIPPAFMAKLFIRRSEEDALGISQAETTQWRSQHNIPDSDAFDAMFPGSDAPEPQTVEKRGRSDTSSTASDVSQSDRHVSKR